MSKGKCMTIICGLYPPNLTVTWSARAYPATNPTAFYAMPTFTVDLSSGPAQSGGFRAGYFKGTVDGKPVRFWASINVYLCLIEQRESLMQQLLQNPVSRFDACHA